MKKYISLFLRLLLGIPLLFFGLLGLLKVLPDPYVYWENPEGFNPQAAKLMLLMWETKFIMVSVGITHITAGFLLIFNRFVPLALLLQLPVSIQMGLFHISLDPATGSLASLILLLNLILIYMYRDAYKSLFISKTNLMDKTVDLKEPNYNGLP